MVYPRNNDPLIVRVQAAPWSRAYGVFVVEGGTLLRNTEMGSSLFELTKFEEGRTLDPSFSISQTEAQVLMDDLWSSGIRPTEGQGTAGAMGATQEHIKDLRKLIFEVLTDAQTSQKM
jgi:hypothetical protein